MYFSDGVLGSNVAKKLRDRPTEALLTIGSDRFSRHDLGEIDCYNFQAAQNLSAILNTLRVKSTRDLFDTVSPQMLALPKLGAVSIAVLGAAFEAKGIGGDAPLEAWLRKHMGKKEEIVTFGAIKHREEREHADDKKRFKKRHKVVQQKGAEQRHAFAAEKAAKSA
jgi:hypothetical protein